MTKIQKAQSSRADTTDTDRLGMPPETLNDLRDLSLRIARGDAPVSLGPKARQALSRVMELQGDPALLSITALADKLSVNPSTLTRLARNLGYDGFTAFQQVLLNASMAAPGQFYTNQARTALEGADSGGLGGVARLCHENQANIDRFLEMCDGDQFAEAIRMISKARRVAIHGIRQFHAFASFLAYGLRMIRSDVHLLDANNLGIAEGLAAMEPGDLLITASCAPYSSQVVETAHAAVDRGLSLMAVTDSAHSPLVQKSRAAILVPHNTSFLSNSMTTFILAAECLINGCAAATPDQAKKALAERDEMIKRLGVET